MDKEKVVAEEAAKEDQPKNVQPDKIDEIKREIMARIDEVEKRIAKVEAEETAVEKEGINYEDEEIGY